MLRDLHMQYGVWGQFLIPSRTFVMHAGNTLIDRVLRAMVRLGVGLLIPWLVYSSVHAHLRQVPWTGQWWLTVLHLQG